ncbi:unnamed protein product [Caenorhabditis sp. 36 PRJEB53466]|nr:unnamed protein product [Caenorhabditis sp. 36 PRJEB53466]
MLSDLKIKLLHTKRMMLGLRQELRNRAMLWEAAFEEIEMLETMAKEAKVNLQKMAEDLRRQRKEKAGMLPPKEKKEEEKDENVDKEGTDDDKKEEN